MRIIYKYFIYFISLYLIPDCPTVQRRLGSETRRDETRHGATRGMALEDEDEREELYEKLTSELVHVPDDARDAVASFLQDLRRDGVDWYAVGDNVRERHVVSM